jgi:protocatechuate 3,4-dioxygenase alpha subunit
MTDIAPTPDLVPASASQTAGPYWHLIDFPEWADTTRHFADALPAGEKVVLTGTVTDGGGNLVTDALIEIWHADPQGEYPTGTEGFQGYARCATDKAGRFRFATLKPGPVPGPGNATQAPHVAVAVFARGILYHLTTRLYFAGEALNETDPVLNSIPADRRATVIAQQSAPGTWNLDLRLQGENETVWMDV